MLLCIAILGGALLVSLILNIAMNEGAYEARTLQKSIAKEAERFDELGAQIDALTSPQALAARATNLGMVPNSDPGIIRLSDGTIIGGATVAGGGQ